MNILNKLFKQKKAKLFNGEEVKEGDKVMFINSDGEECIDFIARRKDGTLFFWNQFYEISDYVSARKVS